MSDYFSTWSLIRTSGFLAYYLMALSLAIGLLSSFSVMKKKKAMFISLHQSTGWAGLLTILFHILLIWQDQYVPYSLKELFIPFLAKNEPFLSALGTISFYLFFIVIGSSDFFIKKMGIKRWKKLHIAVIPAWMMMVFHGILIGTDSTKPWALFLYAAGIVGIAIIGLLRLLNTAVEQPARQQRKPLNQQRQP